MPTATAKQCEASEDLHIRVCCVNRVGCTVYSTCCTSSSPSPAAARVQSHKHWWYSDQAPLLRYTIQLSSKGARLKNGRNTVPHFNPATITCGVCGWHTIRNASVVRQHPSRSASSHWPRSPTPLVAPGTHRTSARYFDCIQRSMTCTASRVTDNH